MKFATRRRIVQVRGWMGTVALGILIAGKVVPWAVDAFAAGGQTVTFQTTTVAQDTYIQGTIIPEVNAELCGQFGLAPGCNASALSTAGCVPVALDTVTKRQLTYRNCTPFTGDAAGENLLAADTFARGLVGRVANDKANEMAIACTNFKALSAGNQNTICTSLGLANACSICP